MKTFIVFALAGGLADAGMDAAYQWPRDQALGDQWRHKDNCATTAG